MESIDFRMFLNSQSILVPILSEIVPEYFNSSPYFNVTDEVDEVVFEEDEKVEEELDSS
jgi:hypothetical protein